MSMDKFLPFIGMVVAIMAQTGSMILNKAAMSKGTNEYIIVVYANALSALILLPYILIFHRSERPPLTLSILCRIFMLALFGCSSQIFGNIGIAYSSPTLATAMLNLIPAFTFILAIIFRYHVNVHRTTMMYGIHCRSNGDYCFIFSGERSSTVVITLYPK